MNKLYFVGILEGYLAAHSPQPPEKVMQALAALREEYEQPQGAGISLVMRQKPVEPVKHPAIQVPDDAWLEVEKPAAPQPENPPPSAEKTVEAGQAAPPEKKPRKPWSDEARAAASARLKARLEAGTFMRGRGREKPAPQAQPVAAARQDTPADELIHDHADYAGQREDKTLVDADWGDIRTMKSNGLPMERIARSYGVDLDYLVRFVARQEDRDAAKNF